MAGNKKMARAVGNALHKNPDPEKIPCYRVVNAKGELAGEFAFGGEGAQARLLQADGEFDIDDVNLVADITHYCIKGLEVPFIYGRIGHGLTEEASKPLVAKVVYGALGKKLNN